MDALAAIGNRFRRILEVVQDVTLFCVSVLRSAFLPPYYKHEIIEQIHFSLIGSLFIVMFSALVAGQALAIQLAHELAKTGTKSELGHFMVISSVRALGPVLTGIVVASRMSAGITAELGTMRSSDQIDALVAFGTDPMKRLVAPRMIGLWVALPLLTIVGDALSVIGGAHLPRLLLQRGLPVPDAIEPHGRNDQAGLLRGAHHDGGLLEGPHLDGRRERRGRGHERVGGHLLGRDPGHRFHLPQAHLPGPGVVMDPAALAPSMLEFRNVTFSIGDHGILSNVSFRVTRGETRVILGPSGSGKSTILRLLMGLWQPDSGAIFVNGEDITAVTPERLREIRRSMGIVFQQGALFDSMTVGENIGYTLLEDKHPEEVVEPAVERYLQMVGLDPEIRDRMPDELSGGMQRRVAIARALAARDPNIILYDEPTTGLDPQSAERITDLVLHLRATMGKTSIMVTHDIADAFKVGDRITVLDRGTVVFEGTPEELNMAKDPFIAEFLAPYRKAVAASRRRDGVPGGVS